VPRFLDAAAAHPGADAVVTPVRRLSYGTLRRAAADLQHRLDRIPDRGPIAILATDAPDRAVAVLAAMASGRPFVLVDPARDADAILATVEPLGARIAVGAEAPRGFAHHLAVDEDAGNDIDLRPVPVPAEHPLAHISTSGSTGDPRYILRTHAAGLNPPGSEVPRGPGDRAFRPFNYSGPNLSSLLDDLTTGAAHLSAEPLRVPPSQMLRFLQEERATLVRATPTVLRLLFGGTDIDGPPPLPALRSVGGGGEPMLWTDVPALRALGPPTCVVRHGYASTETRAISSRSIPAQEPIGEGAVPLGAPVPGRRVWIDAGDGRPAGPGQVGRIVVEGRFGTVGPVFEELADGMLRFRTGDLGELTDEGELLHRGRSDGVVKVGAVRIDPRAVETVLRGAEGVSDVHVVPTDVSGGVRLVAHVSVAPGCRIDAETLRRHATRALASNAVPARFVVHDGPFPQLSSGKVDLRTLTRIAEEGNPK
jgi:acyl-coenzyme A synthetase/AMP-(fatty) acid ligase